MKKVVHKIAYTIFSIFLLCMLLAVDFVSTAKSAFSVSAEEEAEVVNFDETDISNDLKDLDITEYPKNEKGKHEVVLFMEYCYSARPFLAENYGLYLYVYNPTEKAIKMTSTNNVANMATAYNANGEPFAYSNVSLLCLDKTDNNRFYKFKVMDSASFLTRAKSYATAHDGKRRYDVAGVQLVYSDGTIGALESKDEKVAKTYYYTGFAAGCGNEDNAESTLKCEFDDLKTLSLDVHPTYYRPEGNNGKNEYTKDSLHSVYFSVPKGVEEKYGRMSAVHATWLSAVLAPYLVTGNQEACNAIIPYLGVDISTHDENLNYMYLGAYRYSTASGMGGFNMHSYGYAFNPIESTSPTIMYRDQYGVDVSPLYMIFNSGNQTDSADTYVLSSETLIARMKASATDFGGELVEGAQGSYSREIFESVEDKYTELNIQAEDKYDLKSITISKATWWEKLFGASDKVTTTVFDGIDAIYAVQETDIVGSDSEVSNRLYISESDCEVFRKYYETNKTGNTIYLFRYRTSDYIAQEATLLEEKNLLGEYWEEVDTNAYFAQQSVDLNFDIIDITCTRDGIDTVISVVADPLDIAHEGDPPTATKPDKTPCSCIPFFKVDCNYDDECVCFELGCKKWRLVGAAIGIIILIPILYLITYPIRLLFRGANSLARSERKRKNRNKKE